jgi:hypothetical protein
MSEVMCSDLGNFTKSLIIKNVSKLIPIYTCASVGFNFNKLICNLNIF